MQHSGFEATKPESELNRELSCRSKSAKVGTRFPLENILMNVGNRATEDRWCPDTLLFKWFWLEEAAAAAILWHVNCVARRADDLPSIKWYFLNNLIQWKVASMSSWFIGQWHSIKMRFAVSFLNTCWRHLDWILPKKFKTLLRILL